MVGWFRSWERKVIVIVVDWQRGTSFFISGGMLVLPGLVEVAFEHGTRGWWMLLDCFGGEDGEAVDMLSVQRCLHGADGW